ncbi:MAG: FAD-dependent oxidoreductase [Nanoarchaeota archaeon]
MKKLVIIGGGFSGALIAKKLENKFNVTLIDTKDYFEFTPSVLKVIVYPELISKIEIKHKDYLKKSGFILGEVKDVGKKSVLVNNQRIQFDYLVIASGSRYESLIKEKNVVINFRAKNLKECHKCLEKAESVLIIGGGLVGIELASEISEAYPGKKITLISASEKLIPRNNLASSEIVEKHLRKKGVEIKLNETVDIKNGAVFTKDKKMIKSDMTFLCTGIKCNSEFMNKSFSDKMDNGFIKVDKYLRLDGVKNVFVAGDVADIKEEKTAQGAEKQARAVIKNLLNEINNKSLTEYVSKQRPFVISLGRKKGIFEYKKISWCGWIPALMKKFIEFRTMIRYR